jgi:hypothetical protein
MTGDFACSAALPSIQYMRFAKAFTSVSGGARSSTAEREAGKAAAASGGRVIVSGTKDRHELLCRITVASAAVRHPSELHVCMIAVLQEDYSGSRDYCRLTCIF